MGVKRGLALNGKRPQITGVWDVFIAARSGATLRQQSLSILPAVSQFPYLS
jgi:hypothetical protein